MPRRTTSTAAPLFDRLRSDKAEPPSSQPRRPLKVVGLFAGIGGVELGLRRAGHEAVQLCEIDPGAMEVLAHHFPEVPLHDDVRTLPPLESDVDLLAAGFPCQDLSQAGKTEGIEGARSGLVGEVFRLLESRPVPWVLLENVPFMLQLSKGRAMEVIVAKMERLGYKWAYRVVNSRAFGLPQRRERVFFLASLEGDPRDVLFADEVPEPDDPEDPIGRLACGFYWTEGIRGLGWAVDSVPTLKGGSTIGIPSPPAVVMPDPEDGIVTPDISDAERMQGFEVDWTAPSSDVVRRSHRWKLVGNAVTVDVVQWIGERLRQPSEAGRAVFGYPLRRGSRWPFAAWNVGDGRHGADLSTYPVVREGPPLHEFLRRDLTFLSLKATAGFLSRTEVSSLRFPPRFIERLRRHLLHMQRREKGLLIGNAAFA